MDNLRVKYYTNFVHPIFSIFLPFLAIYTGIVTLVARAFTMYDVQVFPPFYFAILLLVGISETVTGNMLYKERIAGFLPRLRELVFVLLISFGLILLFYGELFSGDINLRRFNIWLSLILVGAQWFLSYYIHQRLRERELFLGFFREKEPKEYRDVYNAHNHEGGESVKAMQSVRKLLIAMVAINFLLFAIMTWGFQIRMRAIDSIIVYVFFGLMLLMLAALNHFIETQLILSEGLLITFDQKRRKNSVMLIFFVLAAVVAVGLAGQESLLPQRYLASFLDWLRNLGRREVEITDQAPPEFQTQQFEEEIPDYLGPAKRLVGEQREQLDFAKYIGWALLGLLGVGFLAFLIMPFIRKKETGFNLIDLLKRNWQAFVNGVKNAIESLRASLREMRRRRGTGLFSRIRDQVQAAVERREEAGSRRRQLSRREQRLHSRVLRSFMRFARWARRYDVSFNTSIAPKEFSELVAEKAPEQRDACIEIAQMFEEIMYSHHELENRYHDQYHDRVKEIVKTR